MQAGNLVFGFNLGAAAQVKVGAYGASAGDSVDLGRTDGGVSITCEREVKEVETDQDPGPVAAKETKRKLKLKFKLAEATLANLAVAFNLPTTAVAGGVLSMGSVDADGELYRALYLYLDGPNGATRALWCPKCVITGNAEHAYKKDNLTAIEIEVMILWDTAQGAGSEMGSFTDTASDAVAPTVALSTPADDGTVTQGTKGTVQWTFTEANQIDASTLVYGETVMIMDDTTRATTVLAAGSIAYDAATKKITFTPDENWTTAHTFQAIITTGAKDMAGNALATTKIEQFSAT